MRRALSLAAVAVLLVSGVTAAALAWKPAIAPVAPPQAGSFDERQVEHGRRVAAGGNCVVCHTADGGARNAGGRAMETPFGTVYTTNITPDPDTGIGRWSYAAFERSMRHGIARDGTHLYPAFPYTAFTHMQPDDMESLYAYLMAQPAVKYEAPETALPFPFNLRPLIAGWNLLFLKTGTLPVVAERSEEWNRGYYLVRAVGHCSACHSPRNALGAEKGGSAYLAGADVEGWHAPALNGDSPAPIPWTEEALFEYLRHGYSRHHGAATGSMAPVVREGTSQLEEADTRAIAAYLASWSKAAEAADPAGLARSIRVETDGQWRPAATPAARMFVGACMACHHTGEGQKMFGVQPELWLSTSLYLDKPDNLIRIILDGVQQPAHPDLGFMPAFRHALNDRQIAELSSFLRTRFARKADWPDLPAAVARVRAGETLE